MRFCFVILHYLVPDITMESVDLLLDNFRDRDMSVVVVDNCSPDGSGTAIRERYASETRVHVVQLPVNEGFARGNNVGYKYAVEHLAPDFIIVMNNDVFIEDAGFAGKVEREYKASPFAVLGPDIFSPCANVHQNPSRPVPLTLSQVKSLRCKMAMKYFFFPLVHVLRKAGLSNRSDAVPEQKDFMEPREGCVLHGACYIFSKDFMAARPLAFNPSTFLYCEEDILCHECLEAGLSMRYCPSVSVKHLEDAATKASSRSSFRRDRTKYRRLATSLGVLEKLMAE